MQVQIQFTRQGSSTVVGNFGPGDTLRCDESLAHHLVAEAKVARYMQTPALLQAPPQRGRRTRTTPSEKQP
jgi:hypothetical protein